MSNPDIENTDWTAVSSTFNSIIEEAKPVVVHISSDFLGETLVVEIPSSLW